VREPPGKRKGSKTERYQYNRKNQLVRRAAEGEAWDYTYDLQGNLVREAGPEGERQYLYDTENRQIRVLSGGKEIQEERYDGEGMRAGLTVNGRESTFLYEAGNLYAESDEAGAEISRYIRGNGLAGLEYRGKLYGVHRDEQLSTGWVAGEAGVPESAYEYDAFGMLLGGHGNIPNRLLYGGQQYDAETEQYYLRARYYNPVIGRFMQEDTYRGDGLNLYAYCANNPVMYYDPSGRDDCKINPDAENNTQRENVTDPEKSGVRFPEDPNELFPEDYVGLEKIVKPDGKIDFIVKAGDKIYKIEFYPRHDGDGHYDGDHYHVLKLAEYPKPGKKKPPFFRIPNLDPDTPAQGGTFAPGDLLPTKNKKE